MSKLIGVIIIYELKIHLLNMFNFHYLSLFDSKSN